MRSLDGRGFDTFILDKQSSCARSGLRPRDKGGYRRLLAFFLFFIIYIFFFLGKPRYTAFQAIDV